MTAIRLTQRGIVLIAFCLLFGAIVVVATTVHEIASGHYPTEGVSS